MRVAIHNEFFGKNVAETELARRMCLAGEKLGWEIIEVGSSSIIKSFKPDFVLALHFSTPKVTGFPTYGCMWNPVSFFKEWDNKDKALKNILSYDGYLSSSPQINTWIKDILYGTGKISFICPDFYTSCHQTIYKQPQIQNPRLVYIGTNWDGLRYEELFKRLDKEHYLHVYGPSTAWKYLRSAYKGSLAFDGESVISTLNHAGIGLCLHKQQHLDEAVPSMRIFEIVAAGALAICQDHPFIRTAFGDSVLYIDSNLSFTEQVTQISKHVKWVKDNQQQAMAMSLQAHQIFTRKYSLENLLLNIVPYHQEIIRDKGFVKVHNATDNKDSFVDLIVRVGGRKEEIVNRCLSSIASQTYPNIRVIFVVYKQLAYLENLIEKYTTRLEFKIVNSEASGFRSTQMVDGLSAVNADYFGILDDDDTIHPNHIYLLINILKNSLETGVAYSGSIQTWESDEPGLILEKSELAYFEPFDINKLLNLDNFIVSNSFVARKSLIDRDLLEDPKLEVAEDFFMLMVLCKKTMFSFSYESTCEFYWRTSKQDNSTFSNEKAWEYSAGRIRNMFWKKSFPQTRFIRGSIQTINADSSKENIYNLNIQELQSDLYNALSIIQSMENTKFWKLRKQWFKLKEFCGLVKSDE